MSEEKQVTTEYEKARIDVFTSECFDMTRSSAARLILEGAVLVNGKLPAKNLKLKAGDIVSVEIPPLKDTEILPENIPLDIIYEDEDIVIINKPKGMVVHPAVGNQSGTLVNALMYAMGDRLSGIGGERRPGIVHRIDKDTSGLLVVAKNDEAHVKLSAGLKEHSIDREYIAIAIGNFGDDRGVVDKPIGRSLKDRKKMAVVAGGREAITHYDVLERYDGFTLLHLKLETGRTHQIRVHLASIGHPILGDMIYGGGKSKFERQNSEIILGQTLHAQKLTLTHPRSGEGMSFSCDMPEYFDTLIKKLRAKSDIGEVIYGE